jgi:LmbE family N-acetylglucosaminyl deacetylase
MTGDVPRGLCRIADEEAVRRGVMIVAAHPDDETIGAGGLLAHLPNAAVVHVTDGAPMDPRWWGAPDLLTRDAYSRLRARELAAALDLAGVAPGRRHSLGRVDQRASLDLLGMASELCALFRALRPGVVLTHPYEGGHPDHDAAAFAVRAACTLLEREGGEAPAVLEFTSYFAWGGGMAVGTFAGGDAQPSVAIDLAGAELERKWRMLACFGSQRATLAQFPVAPERFRVAPAYDFTRPPHPGELYYERFEWGTTGVAWRSRAAGALDALGLAEVARC